MHGEPSASRPRTGRMGVSGASIVFEAWGWLFREQQIEDYGIDAHVEPMDGAERPSRQLLALQIKAGASYFEEETEDGWWFRDSRRHWHYWLGHVLPVVIVLYNPETDELFWQYAEASLVQLTGEEGKLLIPRGHVLDRAGAGRDSLRQIVRDFRRADPLADSLPLLPPSAAWVLRDTAARPENTMMLAWQLAEGRHQPGLTATSLLAGQPSWLSDGGGQFEAAIGAYANDHGYPEIARQAFEQAAAYNRADRDRLLSIAALLAVGQDDAQGAKADLAQVAAPDALFPRLARAAIKDHAHPASTSEASELNQAIQDADPAELIGEPTLLNVLASLAVRRGDLEDAVRQYELAAAADPPYPAGRLQLARALVARATGGAAVLAHQDLGRARALALQCLEDMRGWAGPSEQAVSILQQIATVQGAFGEVVQLGSPPGAGGTALEREAADGQVTVLAAEAAAATGNRNLAVSFAAQTTDPAAAAFIEALATDPSAGPAARAGAWRAALAVAATHEQTRRALYQLAAIGQLTDADIGAGEGRGSVSAEAIAVLIARNDAANGQVDPAVTVLREHRDAYPPAAELLIEVLEREGRTDEALEESDLAIAKFGDGTFAPNKLNILARAGRQQDAEAYATSLLASTSALAPEQRIRLRRVLIQNRFNARDFAAAEYLSRDALAENPGNADFAWALITAQTNQGHMDQAAASYHHLRPALSGPELVPLWLDLLTRRNLTDADIEAALGAAEQWPGSVAAKHLIEGTVAMIATLPPSDGQLQPAAGISAHSLTRLAASLRQPGS
jgi:tetratricopeptide (TPR) repeat protein